MDCIFLKSYVLWPGIPIQPPVSPACYSTVSICYYASDSGYASRTGASHILYENKVFEDKGQDDLVDWDFWLVPEILEDCG